MSARLSDSPGDPERPSANASARSRLWRPRLKCSRSAARRMSSFVAKGLGSRAEERRMAQSSATTASGNGIPTQYSASVRGRLVTLTPSRLTTSNSPQVVEWRRKPFSVRVPTDGVLNTSTSRGMRSSGTPHMMAAEAWLRVGAVRLARAAPITRWRYRSDGSNARHVAASTKTPRWIRTNSPLSLARRNCRASTPICRRSDTRTRFSTLGTACTLSASLFPKDEAGGIRTAGDIAQISRLRCSSHPSRTTVRRYGCKWVNADNMGIRGCPDWPH